MNVDSEKLKCKDPAVISKPLTYVLSLTGESKHILPLTNFYRVPRILCEKSSIGSSGRLYFVIL